MFNNETLNIKLGDDQIKKCLVVELFKHISTSYPGSRREDYVKWAVETYKQIEKETSCG